MIRIKFTEPDTEIWKAWRKRCDEATRLLIEMVNNGQVPIITDLYKDKKIKAEYYLNKNEYFHGKCAYCEAYIVDFHNGDIDHFRPKGRVTDENDTIVMVEGADGNDIPHPGYYWLAYDWHNLLLTCNDCNRPKKNSGLKTGKRARFPVAGIHATTPEEIEDEEPLLINPLIDDPKEHLKVNFENGELIGLTLKGAMTIRVFGLNIRDRLPQERYDAAMTARSNLVSIAYEDDKAKIDKAINELEDIMNGKTDFSFAARSKIEQSRPNIRRVIDL